jgi:superfamily II DNA/RNA helicase
MPSDPATFASLGVPDDLVAALAAERVVRPFPIQAATLPDALAGLDICGRAPTGSGKTLAFAIPLVARATRATPHRPTALVLVPTRELAVQVTKAIVPLARARRLFVVSIYGGASQKGQVESLRRSAAIVVATPGRLIDLREQRLVDLSAVQTVVVDEADRMADMGFLPQVRRLLDDVPSGRQTLLWSATFDGDVDALVRRYQREPVRHDVEVDEVQLDAMTHSFIDVETVTKLDTAVSVLQSHGRGIVFCRTRRIADRVAQQLGRRGLTTSVVHGSRTQAQRERAIEAFRRGHAQVLVATDVAARGIHVDGVAVVVHWNPVDDPKDYVHRSGRTARAGASGTVVSLVGPEDAVKVKALQRTLDIPRRDGDGPTVHPYGPRHQGGAEHAASRSSRHTRRAPQRRRERAR